MDNQSHSMQGAEHSANQQQAGQSHRVAHDVAEKGKQAAHQAKERITKTSYEVAHREQQMLAGHLGHLGSALHHAADKLSQENEQWLAKYGHRAAERVEQFGHTLESRDPRELVGQLEDYGRRSPKAFIELAFLGGMLLGRFAKSSSSTEAPAREHAAGA